MKALFSSAPRARVVGELVVEHPPTLREAGGGGAPRGEVHAPAQSEDGDVVEQPGAVEARVDGDAPDGVGVGVAEAVAGGGALREVVLVHADEQATEGGNL